MSTRAECFVYRLSYIRTHSNHLITHFTKNSMVVNREMSQNGDHVPKNAGLHRTIYLRGIVAILHWSPPFYTNSTKTRNPRALHARTNIRRTKKCSIRQEKEPFTQNPLKYTFCFTIIHNRSHLERVLREHRAYNNALTPNKTRYCFQSSHKILAALRFRRWILELCFPQNRGAAINSMPHIRHRYNQLVHFHKGASTRLYHNMKD